MNSPETTTKKRTRLYQLFVLFLVCVSGIVIGLWCMGARTSHEMSSPVVAVSQAKHTATLIFLHGLGDTGHGWADSFRSLKLKNIRCVCPNAPYQPVTLNGGMKMPSWFDILGLKPESPEDEDGIKRASDTLKQLIAEEEKSGIPSNRIMVGGFSQGGAVALYTAFTLGKPLAGVVALSSWMPLYREFPKAVVGNKDIPMLQCHGTEDSLVPFVWGDMTAALIKSFATQHSMKKYNDLGHSSCPEEMKDVKDFLELHLKD